MMQIHSGLPWNSNDDESFWNYTDALNIWKIHNNTTILNVEITKRSE